MKQPFLEIENIAEYGSIVIMRPSTGEVLAMANYPTFDPNDPFTPNTDELKSQWDSMDTKQKSEALNQMWRNKAISAKSVFSFILAGTSCTASPLAGSLSFERHIVDTTALSYVNFVLPSEGFSISFTQPLTFFPE